jgi:DNA-binding transcriptional regulator YhcF (GntR family)
MLSLTISPEDDQPLVDQIVAGIKRQIDDRHLRPGAKLPSIRNFAGSYNVSRFTVVEAYDRLVAMGYLQSRRGSGFFTAAAPAHAEAAHPAPSDNHKRNEELVWLIRRLLEADENALLRAARGCRIRGSMKLASARASTFLHERMAPIYSNTGTHSAICRCASISR